ncbi:uncharacterized protein EV154DRAFT_571983 [Mucor mucedo]|uniref:uncharacterized protein n=1 Tax=Mucor mucedo TaxID=29922 RepID=UPI002220A16E|nr:uncharacterized protein EV154DRAFT_571983 [Mucor mucedo]KAI7866314.1 hypothetical protein EV154DRAFT_571983 [Mucor mucedo]
MLISICDTDTDDYDMTNDAPAVESSNDMVEVEDGSSYFDDNDNHDNYDIFDEKVLVDSIFAKNHQKTLRLIRFLIETSHNERDVIQNQPQGFDTIKNVPSDNHTFAVPKGDGSTVDPTYIKPSNYLRLLM